MAKLKKDTIGKIKADVDLWSIVAKEMEVKPFSLGPILDRNGNNLNQYGVVKAISDYLGVNPEDLIEEETVPVK